MLCQTGGTDFYTVYGVIHLVHGIYSQDCDSVLLILRILKTAGSLG
jgi:hypothetical protein